MPYSCNIPDPLPPSHPTRIPPWTSKTKQGQKKTAGVEELALSTKLGKLAARPNGAVLLRASGLDDTYDTPETLQADNILSHVAFVAEASSCRQCIAKA